MSDAEHGPAAAMVISELGLNSSVELSMRYGVIYADPPWRFKTYSAKGTGRGAISHYDVMTVDELESMPVAEWALPDCVLLLWVPGPHTLQGLELMAAWGSSIKGTGFVWIKTNRTCPGYAMGTGYGARKRVLLARDTRVAPQAECQRP